MKTIDRTKINYHKDNEYGSETFGAIALFRGLLKENILNEDTKKCKVILNLNSYFYMIGNYFSAGERNILEFGEFTIYLKVNNLIIEGDIDDPDLNILKINAPSPGVSKIKVKLEDNKKSLNLPLTITLIAGAAGIIIGLTIILI